MYRFVDDRKRVYCEAGSPVKIKYMADIRKDGSYELVECGQEDLYSFIQSFADSCDINKLVARFQNGEVDVFNQNRGFYSDVTKLPNDMHSIFSMIQKGKYLFDRQPIEIKQEFGNSFENWLMNYDFDKLFKSSEEMSGDLQTKEGSVSE